MLIGETTGWLGQSLYLRESLWPRGRRAAAGRPRGRAAQRRLRAQRRSTARRVAACHDLSDGGLLVGLAEMCIAGGTGVDGDAAGRQRRPAARASSMARIRPAISSRPIGGDDVLAGGRRRPACRRCCWAIRAARSLVVEGLLSLPLSDLRAAHEAWLPTYMNATD